MGKFVHYLDGVISGKRRGFLPVIWKFALLKVSWIYLGIVKLRRLLHYRGTLRAKHLPCKVISIGNIVAGGSGKTPAVIALAKMLKERTDLSVAVLSRGYGSKTRCPAVVSDGTDVLMSPAQAGDEPYMLGRRLPGIRVLIGKDRVETGLMAVRKWDCRIAVLDDGFQYLRLARDLDIVTVDATRPFGFDHVLPRGYLREPLSALKHADLILLTRVDQCQNLDSIRRRLSEIAPAAPIFESVHQPTNLRSLETDQELGLDAIKGKKVLAVCGIANPESFAGTLQSLGPARVSLLSFPDHHEYPPLSIERIKQRVMESGTDVIVTTDKDARKLCAIPGQSILVLTIELRIVNFSSDEFADFILERLN